MSAITEWAKSGKSTSSQPSRVSTVKNGNAIQVWASTPSKRVIQNSSPTVKIADSIPTQRPIQVSQPQQQGIDWGGMAHGALDVAKNILLSPLTTSMKATTSILQPISGVKSIDVPGIGKLNTYQQDTLENMQNAQRTGGSQLGSAVGSAIQPVLDIGSQLYGGKAGQEALTGLRALAASAKMGAKMGAVFQGNQALSQGKNLPDIGWEALKGTGTGAVSGGALHGALAGIGAAGRAISSGFQDNRNQSLPLPLQGENNPLPLPIQKQQKAQLPSIKQNQISPKEGVSTKEGHQSLSYPTNTALPENSQVNRQMFDALNGGQIRERGFVTHVKKAENTPQPVKDLVSGNYVVKSDKQLKADARKLIQADPYAAEQLAINPQTDVHVQMGNELISHYAAKGDFAKAQQIAEGMANSGTELGRAVHAFSQYDKATPEGAIRFAQQKVNEYNRSNTGNKLKITDEQVKSLFDRAHGVQAMPAGRERNIEEHRLMNEINNLIPSTIGDKAITVWKAGLLTSLRTTERNLIGNTMHGVAEVSKNAPAALIDMLLSLKTGKRTLTPTLEGLGSGAKKGSIAAWDIMRSGYDPEEALNKGDMNHTTWGNNIFEKGLGKITNTVFRSLGAQDKPFWHASYQRSLYDQAGAEAINAGKRGDKSFIESLVKNPTDTMKNTAQNEADISTFKNKNALSMAAGNLKRGLSSAPGIAGQVGKVVGDVVLPFTGVPSAIAGQTLAYSPVGLTQGIYHTGKVLAKDVPGLQRQAAQEIGRGIIGSGIMGLGYYLQSRGLMTGQSKDATEARKRELQGIPDNSVFVDGKWRSINSVGPETLVALAGAKAQEEFSPKGDSSYANLALKLGKDQLSQTFLSGVQQPLNALSDPARYGGSYGRSLASSVIPNIVKDTAKSQDPYAREQNTVWDAFKYGLPGQRQTLLPKRNALGNTIVNDTQGINAFIDPFNSRTPINNDPVVNEMARLYDQGTNVSFSKPDNKATLKGLKVTLTPQELDRMEAQTGGVIRPILKQLIESEQYQKASDYDRTKAINDVISKIRQTWDLQNIGKLEGSKQQLYQEIQKLNEQKKPNPFFK